MISFTIAVVDEILTGRSTESWPADVRLLAGLGPVQNDLPRTPYFMRTNLLVTGAAEFETTIFTREVNAWTLGFLCRVPLVPVVRAVARLVAPDGRPVAVGCRVRRCDPAGPGWFDCSAEFCQPRYSFENF